MEGGVGEKLLCSMDMLNDAIKSQGGLLSERGLCRGQGKHWSYSHHITTTGNAQRKRLGSSGIVATIRTRPGLALIDFHAEPSNYVGRSSSSHAAYRRSHREHFVFRSSLCCQLHYQTKQNKDALACDETSLIIASYRTSGKDAFAPPSSTTSRGDSFHYTDI